MSHLYSPKNQDVTSAVNSLREQMMAHCGYVVDRSNPLRLILDIFLTVGMIVFLFTFGKIPGLVLAVYPSTF